VLAEDENPVDTPAPVLLISDRFWQRRFNRDRNVIGRSLRVDGVEKSIIGVMPPHFYLFNEEADFWTPMNWTRTEMQSTQYTSGVAARLKPGVLQSPLLLLQGAVGIVLLIGCANVACSIDCRRHGHQSITASNW
jgi:hypothetical protein